MNAKNVPPDVKTGSEIACCSEHLIPFKLSNFFFELSVRLFLFLGWLFCPQKLQKSRYLPYFVNWRLISFENLIQLTAVTRMMCKRNFTVMAVCLCIWKKNISSFFAALLDFLLFDFICFNWNWFAGQHPHLLRRFVLGKKCIRLT